MLIAVAASYRMEEDSMERWSPAPADTACSISHEGSDSPHLSLRYFKDNFKNLMHKNEQWERKWKKSIIKYHLHAGHVTEFQNKMLILYCAETQNRVPLTNNWHSVFSIPSKSRDFNKKDLKLRLWNMEEESKSVWKHNKYVCTMNRLCMLHNLRLSRDVFDARYTALRAFQSLLRYEASND